MLCNSVSACLFIHATDYSVSQQPLLSEPAAIVQNFGQAAGLTAGC